MGDPARREDLSVHSHALPTPGHPASETDKVQSGRGVGANNGGEG